MRADWVAEALSSSDEAVDACLVSNNLWGGPGSIADCGVSEDPEGRKEIHAILIELGNEQIRMEKVNVRTAFWVEAFTKWRAMGL